MFRKWKAKRYLKKLQKRYCIPNKERTGAEIHFAEAMKIYKEDIKVARQLAEGIIYEYLYSRYPEYKDKIKLEWNKMI